MWNGAVERRGVNHDEIAPVLGWGGEERVERVISQ